MTTTETNLQIVTTINEYMEKLIDSRIAHTLAASNSEEVHQRLQKLMHQIPSLVDNRFAALKVDFEKEIIESCDSTIKIEMEDLGSSLKADLEMDVLADCQSMVETEMEHLIGESEAEDIANSCMGDLTLNDLISSSDLHDFARSIAPHFKVTTEEESTSTYTTEIRVAD
tara:strand:+ start:1768 stop:2277 length:510 start_codon:yes stop_codon:yes gene_type:complete